MVKLRLKNPEASSVSTPDMPQVGMVTEWDDEKGFGFITPVSGGRKVFLHVSCITRESRRPVLGAVFFYTLSSDAKGRPRAIDAYSTTLSEQRPVSLRHWAGRLLGHGFLMGALIVALLMVWTRNCLYGILAGALIDSMITIMCYKTDKYFAQQKIWRIPENCLHGWELLWGWPGALLAQRMFRHKNAKVSYQATFWLCVIANCIGSYFLCRYVSNGHLAQIHDFFSEWINNLP